MNNSYSQSEECVSKIHQQTNTRIYDRSPLKSNGKDSKD